MENTENESVISFDTLFTNNHIQILKILLPYFERTVQKRLAVMIKYLEFQYTVDYFKRNPLLEGASFSPRPPSQTHTKKPDIVHLFSQIRSFCTPSERAMFEQLASLKKNMEMYEELMQMMQLFSELSENAPQTAASASDCASPDTSSDFMKSMESMDSLNPMDMLQNMLTPEQQSMFRMFQSAFSHDNNT